MHPIQPYQCLMSKQSIKQHLSMLFPFSWVRPLTNNARPDCCSFSDLPKIVKVLNPWPRKAFCSRRPLGRSRVVSASCQDIVSRLCQGSGRGITVTRSNFNLKGPWSAGNMTFTATNTAWDGFKVPRSFPFFGVELSNARLRDEKMRSHVHFDIV